MFLNVNVNEIVDALFCANWCKFLNSRTGDGDAEEPGVRWQDFSEAGYIAGDRLHSGEDKYARNKFNQVRDTQFKLHQTALCLFPLKSFALALIMTRLLWQKQIAQDCKILWIRKKHNF